MNVSLITFPRSTVFLLITVTRTPIVQIPSDRSTARVTRVTLETESLVRVSVVLFLYNMMVNVINKISR